MGVIISYDGDKIVNNIAERNAITKRFEGMNVVVKDAIGDTQVGGGEAGYKWSNNRWQLTYKENRDSLQFITEEKTISASKVTASYTPQNGIVFDVVVLDANGDEMIRIYSPNINGKEINIGSSDFEGKTLVFTYGFGIIEAIAYINNNGGGSGVTSYNDLTDKPTIPTVPTAVSAFTNDANYLTSETVTNLSISNNVLSYVNEAGATQTIDLSAYLDNNVSALVNATYSNVTKLMTFTREDNSTFTLDASVFFDDTNLVASVAGKTGNVTLSVTDISGAAPIASPAFTGTVSDTAGNMRSTPISSQTGTLKSADNGLMRKLSGALTIDTTTAFAAGDSCILYNDTASAITITLTGLTTYIAGTNTNKATLTLATRGLCSVLCVATNAYVVSGNIT